MERQRRWSTRFARHSIRWYGQHHPTTLTEDEQDATVRYLLMDAGGRMCRCTRWWFDATLDEEARQLSVTIRRAGDAALDVCPRCALYTQLLAVLESQLPGAQLELF